MRWSAVLLLLILPARSAAQDWNSDSALALARRAIERRTRAAVDTALRDYKAQAHGFLFFLGQFGEGLTEPPRLVKADQLELEVYWKAPQLSKQRIIGWRDRTEIPSDINYHRDHLGIIQNNFGPAIRLGEGDEVRDVPHPLAPGGTDVYDFALSDTTTIVLPQRAVRVVALRVRPKNMAEAGIVGTLFVDAETAELVRMAFNFTPAAYLDATLEDVSIVLDNALWEGRFWLPYRQEVEIRRRATWLDMPLRGIIRGRWEIDNYVFNVGLANSWFKAGAGGSEEITLAPKSERDAFRWRNPLSDAIQDIAEPVRQNDLEQVRAEASRIAGQRALTGLKRRSLGARSVSELIHANRVEGLALGAGFVARSRNGRYELRALGSYGFADGAGKGTVTVTRSNGMEVSLFRQVRDIADVPAIAPLLNSISSQEFGDDYADYFLTTGFRLGYRMGIGARGDLRATATQERIRSQTIHATPATGQYRPNPAVLDDDFGSLAVTLRRRSEGFAVRRDVAAELTLETGGNKTTNYARLSGSGHLLLPVGGSRILARGEFGIATPHLPPHRAFVLGGRSTLLGDEFREWGGRATGLIHLEWRMPVPFVSVAVGPGRTPGTITLAPYVAAGWSDGQIDVIPTPWSVTPGTRMTLGLGAEWLGVFRVEAGYGIQSRVAHVAFDVTRDFWDIL